MAELVWRWRSEELVFLPQRALWRPAGGELLVADLHLGKAEAFQAAGVPLPSDADCGTLNPLLDLCHRWHPSRLIILGDLIHARSGLTERLREVLAALPTLADTQMVWIGGNHDRFSWLEGLPQQPAQSLGDLWLSHEPERPPNEGKLNVCGHLHPVARISGGADSLRLPCFAFDPDGHRLVIPAFGQLTGGHECGELYRQWLVADDVIVPWLKPHSKIQGRRSA